MHSVAHVAVVHSAAEDEGFGGIAVRAKQLGAAGQRLELLQKLAQVGLVQPDAAVGLGKVVQVGQQNVLKNLLLDRKSVV